MVAKKQAVHMYEPLGRLHVKNLSDSTNGPPSFHHHTVPLSVFGYKYLPNLVMSFTNGIGEKSKGDTYE